MPQVEAQALTNASFKKALHRESSQLSKHKSELQIKQSAELIQAKAGLSQLQRDLRAGRQKVRETLSQLRSELRLDLTLEKGKQKDASIGQLLRIQDLHSRVDSEVANGRVGLGKLRA